MDLNRESNKQMSSSLYRQIKWVLALGIVLALFVTLAAVLVASEAGLSLWLQLDETGREGFYIFTAGLVLFLTFSAGILWRLLKPAQNKARTYKPPPTTEHAVQSRINEATQAGIDVHAAKRELEHLSQRRAAGEIHIAVFGEVSAGKSALIKAMVQKEDINVDIKGGTTRSIQHYSWSTPSGDKLVLTDMPGLNEANGQLSGLSQEEALRAHIVVYICDDDLTASQFKEASALLDLQKPMVVALNKTDRYSTTDLTRIIANLQQRLDQRAEVVTLRAGGHEEIIRIAADGREELVTRPIKVELEALQNALQRIIDKDPKMIESLRDSAVFKLVAHKLQRSELAHRNGKADEVVKSYTRKAIVGSLAAVSPGTDIIIQGYLGISMLKELCAIYNVSANKLDMERFLDLSQSHLGKTTPLMLAVIGNGLKAFPGLGTLAGGIVHAVAYGIIFETLGRAVMQTLEQRGELLPEHSVALFKENLSEDLESRAQRLVGLALEAARDKN